MDNALPVIIYVTYSIEKEIEINLPDSAIDYIDDDSLFIKEDFLISLYKENGIAPESVDDQYWEVKK